MKNFLPLITTLGLLAGCANYHASSLAALEPQFVREYDNLEGISVGCKAYSIEECKTYLGRNMIEKGYQPVLLTFFNKSDRSYIFSTKDLNVPVVKPETVSQAVKTSTAGRVIGYLPFIIPSIVDGVKSSNANKRLFSDFEEKSKQFFVIAPRAYTKTVLFIPSKSFSPLIELPLIEQQSGEKTYLHVIAATD